MAINNPQTGKPFLADENPFEAGSRGVDPVIAKMKQEAFARSFNKKDTPAMGSNTPTTTQDQDTSQVVDQPVNRPVFNRPTSAVDQSRQALIDSLGQQAQLPNEEQIRQQELARAQAMIDATKGLFEEEVNRIKQQGAERLQETKSMTVGAGLAGSPFRTTPEFRTQEKTNEQVRLREKERQAEIAQILAAAEGRATDKFRDARDFARQQRLDTMTEQQAAIDLLEQQQERARDTIKTLSQGGYSLDELSEQEYKSLLESSGLSDFEARAIANLNNPASQADYAIEGGKLIGYFIDPVTGKPKISSTEIPGLEGVESPNIQEFDGVPYVIGKDAQGNIRGEVLPGFQRQEEQLSQKDLLDIQRKELEIQKLQQDMANSTSDLEREKKQLEIQKLQNEIERGPESKPAQNLAAGFANRVEQATEIMDQIDDEVLDKLTGKYSMARNVPDRLKSGVVKQQEQAERNFINAILRRESGAAIADTEYESAAKQYFPQAGDTPEVLEQKKENRRTVLNSLIRDAGPAYKPVSIFNPEDGGEDPLGIFGEEGGDDPLGVGFNQVGSDTNKAANSLALGRITGYGSKYWKHGLDIDLKKGDPVASDVDGVVSFVGPRGGFGNQVRITDVNGNSVWYSHLDAADVKPGQRIRRGQILGKGGNTGKTYSPGGGDGSHLDLTVQKPDGTYMTPIEIEQKLRALA